MVGGIYRKQSSATISPHLSARQLLAKDALKVSLVIGEKTTKKQITGKPQNFLAKTVKHVVFSGIVLIVIARL